MSTCDKNILYMYIDMYILIKVIYIYIYTMHVHVYIREFAIVTALLEQLHACHEDCCLGLDHDES